MPRSRVVRELQAFAEKHRLPEPVLAEDYDGHHAFLYSQDGTRRSAYSLTWSADQAHILWVMLKPGTGETEGRRRNTFECCKQWSRSMGYGGLLLGNVFSLRSKSAKELMKPRKPTDDLNVQALTMLARLAPETIVASGNDGAKADRSGSLQSVLHNAKCFGYTKRGQPRHPLYVPGSTPLVAWTSLSTPRCDAKASPKRSRNGTTPTGARRHTAVARLAPASGIA